VNDDWSGDYRVFYKSGKLAYINDYGTDGVFRRYYYDDGTLREIGRIVRKTGKKSGDWDEYHRNGNYKESNSYIGGELASVKEAYDIDGNQIMWDGSGSSKTYFANGNLSYEDEYKNGQRAGNAKWYHENGQLKTHVIYKYNPETVGEKFSGTRWEMIASYDKYGNSRDGGTLSNGYGTWITYDADDNVSKVNTYRNGVNVDN